MRAKLWKSVIAGAMTAAMFTAGMVCQVTAEEMAAEEATFEEAFQEEPQELLTEASEIPDAEEIRVDDVAEGEYAGAVDAVATEETNVPAELDEIGDELFEVFEEADVLGDDPVVSEYTLTWDAGAGIFDEDRIKDNYAYYYENCRPQFDSEYRIISFTVSPVTDGEWFPTLLENCFSSVPDGKILLEWIDNEENTIPAYEIDEEDEENYGIYVTGNKTYTAVWQDAVTVTWRAQEHGYFDEDEECTVIETRHPKDYGYVGFGFPEPYPESGYRFDGWYLDDVVQSEDEWAEKNHTLTGDVTFIAKFAKKGDKPDDGPYTLTAQEMASATPIGDFSSFTVYLGQKGKLVYSFTPTYSGRYIFTSQRSQKLSDPDMIMFDQNGINQNDTWGAGDENDLDFKFDYSEFVAGQKYYFEIHNCENIGENITLTMDYPHTHSYAWSVTTAATVLAEGTRSGSCTICGASGGTQPIAKLPATLRLKVGDVKVDGTTLTMKTKQKFEKIKAEMEATDGIKSVTSNNNLVKVSSSGNTIKLTAGKKAVKKVLITVRTKGGAQKTFTVNVTKKKVMAKKAVNFPKKLNMKPGETKDLEIYIMPVTTPDKMKFSSNKKIVAVNKSTGVLTAKKKGKALITLKVGKKEFKCKVTVK